MTTLGLQAQPRFAWPPEAEAKICRADGPDGKLSVTYDEATKRIGCAPHSIDYKMTRGRKDQARG